MVVDVDRFEPLAFGAKVMLPADLSGQHVDDHRRETDALHSQAMS